MKLNFVWPSTPQYSGGVVALYEFANALARRGHDVHFIHGPAWLHRIDRLEEIDWFTFEPAVSHHMVDTLDDPGLPEGDVIFSPWAPRRLGLPVVFIQGHQMMLPEIERSAFRSRCPKLCVASWLIDIGVEEYGVPREQLRHVPLGIDHDLFRASTPLANRPVDVAVLFHSHPAKGWTVGEAALEAVREHRPDLRVDVFGVLEPDRPIPPWMRFHLNLDRVELARSLSASSLFLQPSWYEGFGFTAVEAMASGCALVSTANGGSQDYALHDETALVVPPGEPVAMAEAIEALLADDGRRLALAAAGERHVRQFDWDLGGQRLEEILEAYVADPAAFQAPPAPSDVPDLAFTFRPGTLMPTAIDDDPPSGGPAPPPVEEELVWNIVWTGSTFTGLQHFAASLIAQSTSRLRFVTNGCPPEQLELMERFRARHPGRVVEVLDVSEEMVAHGVALDRLREVRDDGDWFCLIDPDIKATGPFVADFASLLTEHDAVTSGTEVWSDDNLVPEGHQGVAGEHFFDQRGFVFGSPHLAIYRRTALDDTTRRWGVGFGSAGPELRPETKAQLLEMGHDYLVYDTGKIVNALLQGDGHRLVHRDLPQLVHIGGLAHFISPAYYLTDDQGREVPEWTKWDTMGARHQVTRYTAHVLQVLAAGSPAPPIPPGLEPAMAERLRFVKVEITDLIERYGAVR